MCRRFLELLAFHDPITEFQFVPLPDTNPILIGHRWKEYHEALGLKYIPDYSWETVLKEKPDMIHVLDFPYNGETRREHLLGDKLTPNNHHLSVPSMNSRTLVDDPSQKRPESRWNAEH